MICAQRRLNEELGITGLDLEPRGEVEYRAEVGNGLIEHEVVQVYVAQADFSLPMVLNPSEVQAVKWMTCQDLRQELDRNPTAFTPWLHIYMTQHSDLIFDT
jgi:isopentenyl-diphosphate delta-isomerase